MESLSDGAVLPFEQYMKKMAANDIANRIFLIWLCWVEEKFTYSNLMK
jgi:hypothetical protein